MTNKTDSMVEAVMKSIGSGDMGPGISLRAALAKGMSEYYPDDPRAASRCASWALRHAAKIAIKTMQEGSFINESLDDVGIEVEDALRSEGIYVWGPDGERFERMFDVVMDLRRKAITAALEEQ